MARGVRHRSCLRNTSLECCKYWLQPWAPRPGCRWLKMLESRSAGSIKALFQHFECHSLFRRPAGSPVSGRARRRVVAIQGGLGNHGGCHVLPEIGGAALSDQLLPLRRLLDFGYPAQHPVFPSWHAAGHGGRAGEPVPGGLFHRRTGRGGAGGDQGRFAAAGPPAPAPGRRSCSLASGRHNSQHIHDG